MHPQEGDDRNGTTFTGAATRVDEITMQAMSVHDRHAPLLRRFLAECLERDGTSSVTFAELRAAYRAWIPWQHDGHRSLVESPGSSSWFVGMLVERGVETRSRVRGVVVYPGWRLVMLNEWLERRRASS